MDNPTNYIDKITLPSGTTYTIVDSGARTEIGNVSTTISSISSTVDSISSSVNSLSSVINNMSQYASFIGVISVSDSWTALTDGSTITAVMINSVTTSVTKGNIVIYKPTDSATPEEYIWDGSQWNFFGTISADNLGKLAAKDNATSTDYFLKTVSITNTTTKAISVTTSYQPAGSVTITTTPTVFAISTTTVEPSNTANYWVYNPASYISITASAPATDTSDFVYDVAGKDMVTSITVAAPAISAPTDSIVYAYVENHILSLYYLVPTTANSINSVSFATAVTAVSAPTINKEGTDSYIAPLSINQITSATFTGTTATITSTGMQVIASITSTSGTVTVS